VGLAGGSAETVGPAESAGPRRQGWSRA